MKTTEDRPTYGTAQQQAAPDLFPFEYAGGGYFRQKGIPVGEKAEIIHGMKAIEFATAAAVARIAELEAKADELSLEIQNYQTTGAYERGYELGIIAATQAAARKNT